MKNYKNYLFVGFGFIIAVIILSFNNAGSKVSAVVPQEVIIVNDKEHSVPISGELPNSMPAPVTVGKNYVFQLKGANDSIGTASVKEIKGNWIKIVAQTTTALKFETIWINSNEIISVRQR